MNGSKRIRQFHRWMSILFTTTVIIGFIAIALPDPVMWLFYLPLPPLFLLMFTGLYLFVLPYAVKWRNARHPVQAK